MASITDNDKQKKGNKDILKEMEEEISEIENENGEIDEEKLKTVENTDKDTKVEFTETEIPVSKEEEGFKDRFFKMQADFENYKKRIARDKEDMVFFLKSDILGKILPRIDDLERIINNTPEDLKSNTLFEGVIGVHKKLLADLQKLGVEPFISVGEKVDPNKHNVMTLLPGKPDIIIEEFEKGYLLGDRVLRHSKVVAGSLE